MQEYIFRYTTILTLMLIDIISGVLSTKIKGDKLISAKMATGLYKKMGTIVCMFTADILNLMSGYYIMINLKIVIPVYLYIIVTETLSIYENIGNDKLIEILKNAINGKGEDHEDK